MAFGMFRKLHEIYLVENNLCVICLEPCKVVSCDLLHPLWSFSEQYNTIQ